MSLRSPSAAANEPILTVRDVVVRFGAVTVLNKLSFDVGARGVTALIGPNGAGKTTFFNALSGLVPVQSGDISLAGIRLVGMSPDRIARQGIARTFQIPRGYETFTVFQHLVLHGADNPGTHLHLALSRSRWRPREEELAEQALRIARQLKLDHVLDHVAGQLSGGQKKLLELGRALMGNPRLLLLDEPVAGVNPSLARSIGDTLTELAESGLPVLLIEHDVGLVERVATHVVVASEGKVLREGRFSEIRDDREVQNAYFG